VGGGGADTSGRKYASTVLTVVGGKHGMLGGNVADEERKGERKGGKKERTDGGSKRREGGDKREFKQDGVNGNFNL
jgi:hypothetical protein